MQINLSENMAEFIGILVGDGGINKNKTGGGNTIVIHSSKDDYAYLENHVRPLIKSLFNKNTEIIDRKRRSEILLRICSNEVFDILTKKYGLWYGPKNGIGIPDVIKSASEDIHFAFLRGLFDTDFCFRTVKNNYPIIHADGFTIYAKIGTKRSFKKWITNIGSNNPKNRDKICKCMSVARFERATLKPSSKDYFAAA